MSERFVELGRSAVPTPAPQAIGTYPHPYVVQLSVSGPRARVAVSVGSGHLGSGRVLALEDVVRPDGDVDPTWAEEVELSGAAWALPLLRALRRGESVSEADVVAAYREHWGAEPPIELLPVD